MLTGVSGVQVKHLKLKKKKSKLTLKATLF